MNQETKSYFERAWPSAMFLLGFCLATFTFVVISSQNTKRTYESTDHRINVGVERGRFEESDPLLVQRTILINTEVNNLMVQRVVAQLFHLNAIDPVAPIDIILSSTGGFADDGATIIEAIRTISAPVNTIAMGSCRSAATEILAAGTGSRIITPYTTIGFHIHPVPKDSAPDSMKRVSRTRARMYWKEVASIPDELLTSKLEVSVFLDPETAVSYGIADKVGYLAPNLGVPGDHDPRERGSRPLNTDR